MKKQEMQRLLSLVGRFTRGQRLEQVGKLQAQSNANTDNRSKATYTKA